MSPEEFATCLELALDRPSIVNKLANVIGNQITTDLTNQIDSLKIDIGARDAKISALEDDVKALKPLKNEMQGLRDTLSKRDTRITELEKAVQKLTDLDDEKEQYMRRNSVRISGIPERAEEDPIQLVLSICNDVLKVSPPIRSEDIDRAHRVTKPDPGKQRPMLVKFATYQARNRVFQLRSIVRPRHRDPRRPWQPIATIAADALSTVDDQGNSDGTPIDHQTAGPPKLIDLNDVTVNTSTIFINEDLTRTRAELLFKARNGKRNKHITDCWTFDGVIRIKDLDGNINRVTNQQQLDVFVPPN